MLTKGRNMKEITKKANLLEKNIQEAVNELFDKYSVVIQVDETGNFFRWFPINKETKQVLDRPVEFTKDYKSEVIFKLLYFYQEVEKMKELAKMN